MGVIPEAAHTHTPRSLAIIALEKNVAIYDMRIHTMPFFQIFSLIQ